MAEPEDRVSVSVDAAGLHDAAAFVAGFAARHRLDEVERARLLILVEELLTNLLKYGYAAEAARGRAEIALRREGDHVVLEFADDGRPFDPVAAPPPDLDLPLDERPVGGLGLHLVRSLVEEARYERVGARNRTTLLRRLGAPPR